MNSFREYLNTLLCDCRVLENLNGHFNFVIEPIKLFDLKERNNLRGVIGATAIHFNDTMTYRLTNKDKIEEIINSDDMDIIPYFIWRSLGTYYQPDLSQIDYIFTEKIKRVISNSEETYEIVKEDYPTGLKMKTGFIVNQKN